jgi:hypothetical protein
MRSVDAPPFVPEVTGRGLASVCVGELEYSSSGLISFMRYIFITKKTAVPLGMPSSGILHRVALVRTHISEEL